MKKDDIIKSTDRLHVVRLFDMIADSGLDAFEMIRRYSNVKTRVMADAGEEYFILRQPVNSINDVLVEGEVPESGEEIDKMILHWMADVYIYAIYEKDMTFSQAVKIADPRWLYDHYSPLHEAGLSNCWDKISNKVEMDASG